MIQHRLLDGASGAEVAAAQTDLVDGLIIGRYRHAARQGDDALMSAAFQHCCLVALGGYGRREMAPYSDIDLMFLFGRIAAKPSPILCGKCCIPCGISDFRSAIACARFKTASNWGSADLTVRTSMMEARFLDREPELFQQFQRAYFRKVVPRGVENI